MHPHAASLEWLHHQRWILLNCGGYPSIEAMLLKQSCAGQDTSPWWSTIAYLKRESKGCKGFLKKTFTSGGIDRRWWTVRTGDRSGPGVEQSTKPPTLLSQPQSQYRGAEATMEYPGHFSMQQPQKTRLSPLSLWQGLRVLHRPRHPPAVPQ